MVRFLSLTGAVAVIFLAGSFLLGDDKKDAPRVRGSLPANWSKLGLTDKQKQKIYSTQAEYRAKIEELESKIRELKSHERIAMEKVLTEGQKTRLRELLAEKGPGGASSKEDRKPESKPAPPEKK